jgi:hypothetical protein
MIIETETGDDLEGHRRDLETLRGLVGAGKRRGRKAAEKTKRT